MTTKHDQVVTHREGLPPINSYNPLKIFSREVSDGLKALYLHYHSTYGYQTY